MIIISFNKIRRTRQLFKIMLGASLSNLSQLNLFAQQRFAEPLADWWVVVIMSFFVKGSRSFASFSHHPHTPNNFQKRRRRTINDCGQLKSRNHFHIHTPYNTLESRISPLKKGVCAKPPSRPFLCLCHFL